MTVRLHQRLVLPRPVTRLYRKLGHWRDITVAEELRLQLANTQGSATILLPNGAVDMLSYEQLLREATVVASYLRNEAELGSDALVAVYGANGKATLTAVFGVLLAGLPLLPIPDYQTASNAAGLIQSLGADRVLCGEGRGPASLVLSTNEVECIDLVEFCANVKEVTPAEPPDVGDCDPDGPAMLAMTAGTTGAPKAVVHSHNTLLAEQAQLAAAVPDGYGEILTASPIAHAIGMLGGVLVPLRRGISAHLMQVWNPARALQYSRRTRVNCATGLPSLCEGLIRDPEFQEDDWQNMPVVGLGGAAARAGLVEELDAIGTYVFRSYGSTEHPSVTNSVGLDSYRRLHSEGQPLDGVELRIVDEDGLPIDDGRYGYVESRGPDLCIGMVGAADATSSPQVRDGWLRTGDVGRIDDRGALWDVARPAETVKSYGVLVNLVALEAKLSAALPSGEFAIASRPSRHPGVDTELVVCISGEPASLSDLRVFLRSAGATGPELPSAIEHIPALPRTALGKLDRGRLNQLVSQ
jgi:acyl-CoA synthetase (AMP-forming)/AMP-acid ligase II